MNIGLADQSGRQYHRMHPIIGFAEGAGGLSGGLGYGAFMETRAGTWFSAYHAGSLPEADDSGNPPASNGWVWYFTGSKSRTPAGMNYGISSNGRMHSGYPDARMSSGYESQYDAWTIRDETNKSLRFGVNRFGGAQLSGKNSSISFINNNGGRPNDVGHRLSLQEDGSMIYNVSNLSTTISKDKLSWSVSKDGVFDVSNLVAEDVTLKGLLKLKSYSVSNLPVCSSALIDALAVVIDALPPDYNSVVKGGGNIRVPVYCNGYN